MEARERVTSVAIAVLPIPAGPVSTTVPPASSAWRASSRSRPRPTVVSVAQGVPPTKHGRRPGRSNSRPSTTERGPCSEVDHPEWDLQSSRGSGRAREPTVAANGDGPGVGTGHPAGVLLWMGGRCEGPAAGPSGGRRWRGTQMKLTRVVAVVTAALPDGRGPAGDERVGGARRSGHHGVPGRDHRVGQRVLHVPHAGGHRLRVPCVPHPHAEVPALAYASCTGSSQGYHQVTGLADGAWTVEVRAVDGTGPGTSSTRDWAVTSDPVVQWISEPQGNYSSRWVTATFTAPGASSFQCRLNGCRRPGGRVRGRRVSRGCGSRRSWPTGPTRWRCGRWTAPTSVRWRPPRSPSAGGCPSTGCRSRRGTTPPGG